MQQFIGVNLRKREFSNRLSTVFSYSVEAAF